MTTYLIQCDNMPRYWRKVNMCSVNLLSCPTMFEMFNSLFLTLYSNWLSKINQSKSVTSSLGLTYLIISQYTIVTTVVRCALSWVWWSYCNLQDHSELISPCAPALIWGVTNWMLINHKAGRKRWPSERLWACISSRLPRARTSVVVCAEREKESARCKLQSVICVEPDRERSERGKQISGRDYLQSYLMTCGLVVILIFFGHYSDFVSIQRMHPQIISKRNIFSVISIKSSSHISCFSYI